MKECLMALIFTIIYQILSWCGFVISNECIFKNYKYIIMAWIVILIIGLISYFIVKRKITRNSKYNFKKYQASIFLFYLFSMLLGLIIKPHDIIKNIPPHDCHNFIFECGLEYDLFWLSMWIPFILVTLYEFIRNIFVKKT